MKLTLTFYQYPQALAEIEFWEKSQKHRITSSSKNSETKEQVYHMPGEVLVCLPMNLRNGIDVIILRRVGKWLRDYKYHKTLVFGKVDLKILNQLTNLQMKLECGQQISS